MTITSAAKQKAAAPSKAVAKKTTKRQRASKVPSTNFCEGTINVLGYREDDEWVALALEMDLRGYGDTFEAALEELFECVTMQISFAQFKGEPDMILHPAASEFFSLFAQVRQDILQAITRSGSMQDMEYHAGGIPIPPPHVIEASKQKFSLANG
jgi:hypothetical protein